ncbi:MAG: hypothetical protein HY294_02730 [Candidatus Rokubacteria bacterium]|nr:hypothetical protein [Candidatus Rokubacteria bacterium]
MTVARRWPLALLVTLLLVTPPMALATSPPITGQAIVAVICPAATCGVTIFGGSFLGTINGQSTAGSFGFSPVYGSLPVSGSTAITQGGWVIYVPQGVYGGLVTSGTITANTFRGKPTNTYTVSASLSETYGGTGTLTLTGVLNNITVPATLVGSIH